MPMKAAAIKARKIRILNRPKSIGRSTKAMTRYRTLDNLEEEYFQTHPEEIDFYMIAIFEAFAKDGDSGAFLASLRTIARVKGISTLAEETGMTRQGLQKALSAKGNPRLESVNAIMKALGYRLTPQKLEPGHVE
jgi:probable addiction module antidote protein